MRAVDLGSGTGELTRLLHERLGCRSTVGIDSSEAMLARATAHRVPGLEFRRADLRDELPEGALDLVFSNAALQWVDDHPRVLTGWTRALGERGQIAVQVPANYEYPSHTVAARLALEAPFRDVMAEGARNVGVLPVEAYAEWLHRLGFRRQKVWARVYAHVLESRAEVIEWVRGTCLTDYERRLPPERFQEFLQAYRAALFAELPDERPFFYPFKRILFWGSR